MEPSERELLAAVAASPQDDAPRLVLADWWTERGDPRGPFVALQCELARTAPWDPRHAALAGRCRALLAEHRGRWEPAPGAVDLRWTFERGFPSRVGAPARALLSLGPALLDAAPTLTAAIATRFDAPAEDFLAWPVLPRLGSLSLWYLPQERRSDLLRTLLGDERLQHLDSLELSYSYLGRDDWQAIASSPLLPRLERLSLALCNARNDDMRALMAAPSRLGALCLASGQLGTDGAAAIADSPYARSLRRLDLSWNRLGVKAARALAASEHLSALEVLDLSHCQVGDPGCEALATGRLTSLRLLRLGHSRVGPAGAQRLVASEPLGRLVRLEIEELGLDPEVARGSRP